MGERALMHRRLMRLLAASLLVVLFGAACGQKARVHIAGATRAGSNAQVTEDGEVLPGEESDGALAVGEGGVGGGAVSTTTKRTGQTASGAADQGGQIVVTAADKTGVTETDIKVGFHAPLTGAAAVPLIDIDRGTTIYQQWAASKGVKIWGRNVSTIWRDDQYSPSHAVEVCREMVEKQKVFLLIGGAGTDQILACARYAARAGVPYLSAGVTEKVVGSLKNYFAFTMSYPQQAKPLAEMIYRFDPGSSIGGKVYTDRCDDDSAGQAADPFCRQIGSGTPRVAVLYSDTEGFFDARDEFLRQWKAVSGVDVHRQISVTKFNISTGQANDAVLQLKNDGIDVVYVLTAPTNWLSILRVAQGQRYAPRWVGVGLTMGVNTAATAACGQSRDAFENSLFMNPWMTVDNPNYNSQFAEAWAQFGDGTPFTQHDIAFGLWGGSIVQHALFQAAGRNLSRSAFVAAIENLQNGRVPKNTPAGSIIDIYSVQNYTSSDHFGANQFHLLYGNCSAARWSDVPGRQFVSGF